ncbi:MAG: glycosyltransferase [Methyloprofundus sp.]|nr:glycosyltransferase [Methyloprofundus sp.]
MFQRIAFKGLGIFERVINLYKLVLSDIVYILPMSHLNAVEIFLAKKLKKRVIGEFYISMFDTYVNDRRTVSKDSPRAKKLTKLDQNFIDVCHQIIFLNASEREYYLTLASREDAKDKTALIPLATNPKQRVTLSFANDKTNTLTLCWWGTFIPLHGLEKILEAAKYIKAADIDFKLYLFGTSEEKSLPYKKQIEDLGLQEYVFIDNTKNFADKSLDQFLIEHCDIAFGNFGDSVKAKTVMVNKVVESVSMGLPVISQQTSALAEYFEDGKSIAFCESEPEKIAKKVIALSKDKAKMKSMAESGFQLYKTRFSKEAYLQDIIPVLENTTN